MTILVSSVTRELIIMSSDSVMTTTPPYGRSDRLSAGTISDSVIVRR